MGQSNSPNDGVASGADGDAGRDPRLAWFGSGGRLNRGVPDAGMALVLEGLCDGAGRPPGAASDDEVVGMLGRWQAVEAHAHGRLLAAARELLRRRPEGGCPVSYPGELPARWVQGAVHEASAELRISWQSADPLLVVAWDLEARLPGAGRLLDQGILTALKAKIVSDEFAVLDDGKAAEAEKLLLENDLAAAAMIPSKLRTLCQRLVCEVDPDGARRRREVAERENARVVFFRNRGGDMAMFAEGLPADQTLMAQANLQTRALAYKQAGVEPGASMDLLRVLAMLDLINEVSLEERIARARGADASAGGDGNGDGAARGPHDGGGGDGDREDGDHGAGLPALVHLTLPLATLAGMAERPGEAPGFGALDPGLVRNLGHAAVASPRTKFCFTVTDDQGHATGHACARLIRGSVRGNDSNRNGPAPGDRTVRAAGWKLEPDGSRAGPDGGYGAWILSAPGGARYRLAVVPVPLHSCDHRFATDSYRPGALLRHLVEVRDGECSFTGCSHPASQSDYEHTIPWDKGGKTDVCNGGPRSRRCHRVKQSRGWRVSQPEPGRHLWHTPAGRTYEKGPKSYPA